MKYILMIILLLVCGCVTVTMVKDDTGLREIKYRRYWGSQGINGFEMKKDGSVKFNTQKADSGMPWQSLENISETARNLSRTIP